LGLAYVEQARVTAESSYYPKAEQALDRAAALDPDDDLVLAGQAALASARHDFTGALSKADAALAVNPYSSRALVIRADALTELGRYDEALAAAKKADKTRPGVATFARLSYARELRGDVAGAIELMQRAAEAAASPADAAFAYYQLGELERGQGRYMQAANNYNRALRASPQDVASRAGNARVLAAQGETAKAIEAYRDVVDRLPLPEYVIELGELYEASGNEQEAEAQYAVVRAGSALAQADGVNVDLETAYFEADHGDPDAAVAAASAEWEKRRAIVVADALGWALHAAGRDREALGYVRLATRLGTKDARFLYHRGMIELALGQKATARKSLEAALAIDPMFSPLHAPRARAALNGLAAAGSGTS
jgi:tetratricopeptide (TPR) repeat protein